MVSSPFNLPMKDACVPTVVHSACWPFLRQHGDFTLAYATAVQPALSQFYTSDGYLAFITRGRHAFVLGDPLAAAEAIPDLIAAFLAEHPQATFVQISADTAAILQQHGYYLNEMGIDTAIDLTVYTFQGKSREWLRYSSNWIHRRGYRIEEASVRDLSISEMESLSAEWRQTRKVKRREVGFLNRPIVYADEPDVRKFFLFQPDGPLAAMVFFDPLYRDGRVIGYCTCIKRRRPGLSPYAEPAIMKFAMERFQDEKVRQLNLGLSPLAGIVNDRFRRNPFLHFSFRYGFRAWWVNRYYYNLQGHAHYKRRYGGQEFPTYYASPVLFNDVRIWKILRMCGLL